MTKYSFVIPSYNYLNLLKNTLAALNFLITDDHITYEVIVVDDGSDDCTCEYTRGLKVKYELKYIYLERSAHSSRARARNKGIEAADGDIVVFIDADIIVKPNYLLELNKFFEHGQSAAVAGLRKLINETLADNAVSDKLIFCDDYLRKLKTSEDFRYYIFEDISYNAGTFTAPFLYAQTCNLSVPKKWIDQTSGFDEDLIKWGVEDIEFAYRLHLLGMKIVTNPKNAVLHQFHGVEQKSIIDKRYEKDIRYNTGIFTRKHPGFLGLEGIQVYELFKSIGIRYKDIEQSTSPKEDVIFDIQKQEDISDLKRIIMGNDMNDKAVRINDYLEDSDLYVWIQTLPDINAKIRYYPVYVRSPE